MSEAECSRLRPSPFDAVDPSADPARFEMVQTPRSPSSSGSICTPPLSPTASQRMQLVRSSSGNQSVGHLSHSPHGFSKLHRPDVTFSCGGLLFPVHSLLLAVSSRFWTEFFSFIQGQHPEVISLDAVKCEALSALSLGHYLTFIYSGALPAFDAASDAVELLRLGAFFSNAALTAQLSAHLAGQLAGMEEQAVLEVFRAAVDLQQRRLVAECLSLLLPQFGRAASDGTVAAVIDYMDATLSKVVLTQLTMQGGSPLVPRVGTPVGTPTAAATPARSESDADSNLMGFDFEVSLAPQCCDVLSPGQLSPLRAPSIAASSLGGASRRCSFSEPARPAGPHAEDAGVDALKRRFVSVLEERGWGS